ncbi:MAG: DUF4115 domain-containing protein [Gammaproteobacteria bacterium]|nr:DUF4115 domain-containing protein [Gammaproteobacteria bacterium]
MTDRSDKESIGGDMEGPGIQLRRAREAKGLLLHDIAQELHLDEWMLQALEEDDFAALGAPVFAKGHMRKYGGMLGLDTDDLMIAYYRKRGRDDSPPPITHLQAPSPPSREFSWAGLRWLLAGLAAILFLVFLWALLSRDNTAAQVRSTAVPDRASPPAAAVETDASPSGGAVATDEPEESDVADETATDGSTAPSATEVLTEGPAAVATETATDAAPDPAAAAAAAAGAETVQLRLSVSGDSWVEVTDSQGKQLIYGMVSEGRTRSASGVAPIEVFLGRSRVVRLEVDGEFYPVPRRAVRGNTARFVIDPDAP